MTELERIRESLAPHGLALRGGFHPAPQDGAPLLGAGRACGTILLLGNLGGALWPAFADSPELADGAPHALDRWTRRILESLAPGFGATALFPFGGPPWLPFQRWAMKADCVAASPLGILIHPDFGLWHAYRGALAFAERLDLPPVQRRPSPCDSCIEALSLELSGRRLHPRPLRCRRLPRACRRSSRRRLPGAGLPGPACLPDRPGACLSGGTDGLPYGGLSRRAMI